MSGAAPSTRGITTTLKLPRVPARRDDTSLAINTGFDMIERADGTSVKSGQQPSFPGIVLLSPSRIGYLVTVTDAGALQVTQLPATRPY